MPAMSLTRPESRGELLVWDRVLQIDDGGLFFWHGYTPPNGTEVDLLIADLNSGVYCIEIKGLYVENLKYLDLDSMISYSEKAVYSPFKQSLKATRSLAGILKANFDDAPWLSPIAAFPFIKRSDWIRRFPTGSLSNAPCLLQEDFASLDDLRSRLSYLAMHPPMGLGRHKESRSVTLEQVRILHQLITGQSVELFPMMTDLQAEIDSAEKNDRGPDASVETVESEQSADPIDPVEPVKPVESEESEESVESVESVASESDSIFSIARPELVRFDRYEVVNQQSLQDSSYIHTILRRAISLLESEGEVYGSPGLDVLIRWREALLEGSRRLRVSVIGEFKAGKSSLINALFHRTVCFVDEFEATGIRAVYTDGAVESAILIDEAGKSETTTLEHFLGRSERRDTRGLKSALITLRTGFPFDLADSPGLGTHTAQHSSQAEEELRRTDLLLFTIDCNDPGSAQESALLARATEIGLPLIVLLTKADLLDTGEEAQLREYLSNETGVANSNIIAVSAHRYVQGGDAGVDLLLDRLITASETHKVLWRSAQLAKEKEVANAVVLCLKRLLDMNEPNSKFVRTELVYLERSAAELSRIAKHTWLESLKNEVSGFLDNPEIQQARTGADLQRLVHSELSFVMKRATNKFIEQLHTLIINEWRKDLESHAREYQQRLDDLLARQPDSVDLAFLASERDAFSRRAQLVIDEQADSAHTRKLLTVGLGIAAAILTASFAPLAIAAVAAVFMNEVPRAEARQISSLDPTLRKKIENHLVTSFEQVAPFIEDAIEDLVEEVASKSLMRILREDGRPDISIIGNIERKAHDILDELAECNL